MRYLFTPRPEAAAQMHDHNRYRCDPSQLVSENYLSQFITVQVVSNELYDQCNVFARLSHIDTNMRVFHCLADYGASQSIHAWGRSAQRVGRLLQLGIANAITGYDLRPGTKVAQHRTPRSRSPVRKPIVCRHDQQIG
ncbi:hypothetical protein [Burkholderia territorii]|uniref:hypothetical protein n=1 Tax=Burkholderia territorii TaxID=1503055 RepID=UPI001E48C9BA|nr:hypothetical protein [Burkholderia territorii]